MSLLLYNIFLRLYSLSAWIAALFNAKAKKWIYGRKKWQQTIPESLTKSQQNIWIHCSSLGEFEQARPIIESLKKDYPHKKIVLTFFSPSGYEIRKNYALADYIFYLPLDGYSTAKKFITGINPSIVIFVKYEFWYYYLTQLRQRGIPTLLISGAFRLKQPFFKWYGTLFRKVLTSFQYIFVQDNYSKELLAKIGYSNNVIVGGDTRYDRVAAIAHQVQSFPLLDKFKNDDKLIIAGSTWPTDETLLKEWLPSLPNGWKLVIAPHEVDIAHITQIKNQFADNAILYSQLTASTKSYKQPVLIIDNIGMLSSLFSLGRIAYIGGGFQKGGIHNTLEPAIFGLPVIFGPNYEKFIEAVALEQHSYAFPVNDVQTFDKVVNELIIKTKDGAPLPNEISNYIHNNTGATEKVMKLLAKEYFKTP